jgi:hypothetical protein
MKRKPPSSVYRPSNGTEGQMFEERWCRRCVFDDVDGDNTCDRVMRAMLYEKDEPQYPKEWRIAWLLVGFKTWCTAFKEKT